MSAPPVPTVHHIPAEGPLLSSGADALGLIYGDGAGAAEWIAVPVARLDPSFFTLSSGVAGDFVPKFVDSGLSARGRRGHLGPLAESARPA